jgi:hypothetical protein
VSTPTSASGLPPTAEELARVDGFIHRRCVCLPACFVDDGHLFAASTRFGVAVFRVLPPAAKAETTEGDSAMEGASPPPFQWVMTDPAPFGRVLSLNQYLSHLLSAGFQLVAVSSERRFRSYFVDCAGVSPLAIFEKGTDASSGTLGDKPILPKSVSLWPAPPVACVVTASEATFLESTGCQRLASTPLPQGERQVIAATLIPLAFPGKSIPLFAALCGERAELVLFAPPGLDHMDPERLVPGLTIVDRNIVVPEMEADLDRYPDPFLIEPEELCAADALALETEAICAAAVDIETPDASLEIEDAASLMMRCRGWPLALTVLPQLPYPDKYEV